MFSSENNCGVNSSEQLRRGGAAKQESDSHKHGKLSSKYRYPPPPPLPLLVGLLPMAWVLLPCSPLRSFSPRCCDALLPQLLCDACGPMHCITVLQKLWETRSKGLQGQQDSQHARGARSLGASIFPPANSCLPFAHICALWLHFKSADTPCMHVAAPFLHADCLHILHKHPRVQCTLLL